MYYLQSRYYDAKISRFINADSALYHSMLGYNLFAYCGNNPINRFDSTRKYYEDLWDSDGNPLNDGLFDGITGCGGTYYIGPDGKAVVDIDYFHPGPNHNFPHVHFFDWSKTNPRGDEIDLFN